MKLAILIPSDDYRHNAGTRIRYARLQPALAAQGVEMALLDVSKFDPTSGEHDAIIISKVHDVRGLLAAAHAARAGMAVGVDLFDDYFSQRGDPRLNRFRRWLSQLAPRLDFAISSTRAMADRFLDYRPGAAIEVIRDTADAIDQEAMRSAIEAKQARLRDDGVIRVGWYGVGDNPFFPVGLSDLVAFSGALHRLSRRAGMPVKLSILTNERALDTDALARLRNLPVLFELQTWSIEREQALLEDSFAIFLPVNGQNFSVAKSPNRAITALSAGCQVLSVGHDLYADFEDLIYRDPDALADDIKSGECRLSEKNLTAAASCLDAHASSEKEAQKLVQFLSTVSRGAGASHLPLAVIQGMRPIPIEPGPLMEGVLRVRGPYGPPSIDDDARAMITAYGEVMLEVAKSGLSRLTDEARKYAGPAEDGFAPIGEPVDASELRSRPIGLQLARYAEVNRAVRARMVDAFGPHDFLDNEQSEIPFPVSGEASR